MSAIESILLVRHAQSKANTRELVPMQHGDQVIPLSDEGTRQAKALGKELEPYLRGGADNARPIVYCSPYMRTRQTLEGVLDGAGMTRKQLLVYEDPRLREVDRGYGSAEGFVAQQVLRERHGWFYYRFDGGESPADCYDRVSAFVDSMFRQAERKGSRRILIVSHGLTIRCLVMRFLHLAVEDYDRMDNPDNASVIEIAYDRGDQQDFVFRRGRWGVRGIRLREPEEKPPAEAGRLAPESPVTVVRQHAAAERRHCFDAYGTSVSTGWGSTWDEKCCRCGETRSVTQTLEVDPAHGPHVQVTRASPLTVTRKPKSDVCVPVPLPKLEGPLTLTGGAGGSSS